MMPSSSSSLVLMACVGFAALLLLAQHAQALTCTPPQHEQAGKCTDPAWESSHNLGFTTPAVGTAKMTLPVTASSKASGTGFGGVIRLDSFRADKLSLKITKDATKPDLFVVVREDGVFHSEFNINEQNNIPMEFTARGNWYGRGQWEIYIVNWGATSVSWNTNIITSNELSCLDGANFRNDAAQGLKTCMPKVCTDNYHTMPSNTTCESPKVLPGGKLLMQESGSTAAAKKFVGGVDAGVYSLKFGEYLEHSFANTYRSMKLEVTITPDANSEAPHLYLWVMSSDGGEFLDELATAGGVSRVFTNPGGYFSGGQWTIRLLNWAPDGSQQLVRPSRIQVRLFCDDDADFYLQSAKHLYPPDIYIWMACMPILTGECESDMLRNWNDKGCTDPTVVLSAGNQLEVEPNASGSSGSSKVYVGKSGISKAIAPKEALIVELENVRSDRVTVQLVNPDGATPADLEVRAYFVATTTYYDGFFTFQFKPYSYDKLLGWGATGGQSKTFEMITTDEGGEHWGRWRIAVVNWGLEAVTVPISWLKLTYFCSTSAAFTDQGDGISSCEPVRACPAGKHKVVGAGGAPECVLPVIGAQTFDVTFSQGNAPNKLNFVGQGAPITLQPRTGVMYEIPHFAGQLDLTALFDAANPDIWMRIYVDENVVPFEIKPNGATQTYNRNWISKRQLSGRYIVEVVNWGTTAQVFTPTNFVGQLSCSSNENGFAVGFDGVSACFQRCPYGTFRDMDETQSFYECDTVSFPDDDAAFIVPVTQSSPNGATRVLTPKPVFMKMNSKSGVSIIADNLRADKLEVTIPIDKLTFDQGYYSNNWYAFIFNGDTIVDQFSLSITAHGYTGEPRQYTSTATGENKGKWRVAVAILEMDRAAPELKSSLWLPEGISFELSCDYGDFKQNEECPPPPPPPAPPAPPSSAALTCAFTEPVGFNPWERWNLFSLVGKLTLDGSHVQGRVAGVSDIEASGGARVHTQKEAFITRKDDNAVSGPWSITAGGAVTLDGATTVVSMMGGIEAVGTISKANGNAFNGKQADTKPAVGGLVAGAVEYFSGRSTAWGGLDESWIGYNLTATELAVRVHGKVNVVNVANVAALAGVERITLTGHPAGTLIVNVQGPGTLVLRPTLQVTYTGKPHGGSTATNGSSSSSSSTPDEPPTFGRVVLNVAEATGIAFAASAPQQQPTAAGPVVVHVSILAPKADVTFDAEAPEVKGTVVAKSLTVHNNFALQPFGTLARRLGAVPTLPKPPTSSAGRSKTACLWHVL